MGQGWFLQSPLPLLWHVKHIKLVENNTAIHTFLGLLNLIKKIAFVTTHITNSQQKADKKRKKIVKKKGLT